MKTLRLIFVLSFAFMVSACGTTSFDASNFQPQMNATQLLNNGEYLLAKREYKEATNYFDAISVRYPFGQLAQQAQLYNIYAYYESGQYAVALANANRFTRLYPLSNNVGYAFYMKGLANFNMNFSFLQKYLPNDLSQRDLTPLKNAFKDFAVAATRFPSAKYAPDARQHMIYIRNLIAEHELKIARFYFERDAYLAALDRANDVVKHYQGTDSVHDALVIVAQSAEKLGLDKQATDAKTLLQMNYPKAKA